MSTDTESKSMTDKEISDLKQLAEAWSEAAESDIRRTSATVIKRLLAEREHMLRNQFPDADATDRLVSENDVADIKWALAVRNQGRGGRWPCDMPWGPYPMSGGGSHMPLFAIMRLVRSYERLRDTKLGEALDASKQLLALDTVYKTLSCAVEHLSVINESSLESLSAPQAAKIGDHVTQAMKYIASASKVLNKAVGIPETQ